MQLLSGLLPSFKFRKGHMVNPTNNNSNLPKPTKCQNRIDWISSTGYTPA